MKKFFLTVTLMISMLFPSFHAFAKNADYERPVPAYDLKMGCMGISTEEKVIGIDSRAQLFSSEEEILKQLTERLAASLETFDLNPTQTGDYVLSTNVLDFRIPLPIELPVDPETGYNTLPKDVQTLIDQAFFTLLQNTPEKFYLANGYQISTAVAVSQTDGTIQARYLGSVDFILYHFNGLDYSDRSKLKQSFSAMENEIQAAAAPFIDSLKEKSLTDEEKVLLVHDYIVSNCKYYTNINIDDQDTYHTMYSLFTQGTAVCEGYAKASIYLLKQLGFSSDNMKLMTSRYLGHMWNLIRLDGKWYHYDATWDDPSILNLPDYNALQHKYFLLSDTTNIEKRLPGQTGLYDGVCYDYETIPAEDLSSKKYESGYLFNLDSRLQPFDPQSGSLDSLYFCYENGTVVFKTNLSNLNTDKSPVITFPANTLKPAEYIFSFPYGVSDYQPVSLNKLKNSTTQVISMNTSSPSMQTPEMIYAFYDQNGAFCAMQTKKITSTKFDNNFLNIPQNAVCVKLFILKDTKTLLPLSGTASIR